MAQEQKTDKKTYRVRVTNEFRATTNADRRTAGLVVPQTGDGIVTTLTADQLSELKGDQYVTVEAVKA